MAQTRQKPPKRKNHFKNRKGKSVKPNAMNHGLMLNAENFEKAM